DSNATVLDRLDGHADRAPGATPDPDVDLIGQSDTGQRALDQRGVLVEVLFADDLEAIDEDRAAADRVGSNRVLSSRAVDDEHAERAGRIAGREDVGNGHRGAGRARVLLGEDRLKTLARCRLDSEPERHDEPCPQDECARSSHIASLVLYARRPSGVLWSAQR